MCVCVCANVGVSTCGLCVYVYVCVCVRVYEESLNQHRSVTCVYVCVRIVNADVEQTLEVNVSQHETQTRMAVARETPRAGMWDHDPEHETF